MRLALVGAVVMASLLSGCELLDGAAVPCGQATVVQEPNGQYLFRTDLEKDEVCSWPFVFSLAVDHPGIVVEVTNRGDEGSVTLTFDGAPEDETGWISPRVYKRGSHVLKVTAKEDTHVDVLVHLQGEPAIPTDMSVAIERPVYTSQSWYSGIHGMMGLVADDGHGGRLLEHWLASMSQGDGARAGPGQLLAKLKQDHGDDAAKWVMSSLPFRGVIITNRIDLLDGVNCGELHFVVTSTAAGFEKLNFRFRFVQPPQGADVSKFGTLHCMRTARDWAAVGTQPNPDDPVDLADDRLTTVLTRVNFKSVQVSEAIGTDGDWQFREWKRTANPDSGTLAVLPNVLAPITLEQTVDVAKVNAAGTVRDQFLAYVSENAAALTSRRSVIPEAYRTQATHLQENAWTNHTNQKVDLTGVDAAILAANPTLRPSIEVVGCSGCHGASASAVHVRTTGPQTDPDKSAFLREELRLRKAFLTALQSGPVARPAYGPMQTTVLPPE